MMELDELKQKWAEHDRKLEVNIRLTRQLLSAKKNEPSAVRIAAPGRFPGLGVGHRACRHHRTWLLHRRPHCNGAVCGTCCLPGPVRDCNLDCADTADWARTLHCLQQASCGHPKAA